MSKFNFEAKDGKLSFSLDLNEDGESSVKGSLSFSEAIQEIIKRGEAVEGAELVEFSFDNGKIKVKLDTDKDGEELLSLEIDLGEGFDEAKNLITK